MKTKADIFKLTVMILSSFLLIVFANSFAKVVDDPDAMVVKWEHLSSLQRELPFAEVGAQVSTLIMDIDQDGLNDFVIAGWGKPSMVWFKRHENGWSKYLIDAGT
jgi:hypothetical protein